MAAGSFPLQLLGVLTVPLVLSLVDTSSPIKVVLHDVVIVKNLGQKILIGEPGKEDNGIVTNPMEKLISFHQHGEKVSLPYFSRKGEPLHSSFLLRSEEHCTM